MKVAELIIAIGGYSRDHASFAVGFNSLDTAYAEFERISALLKRRDDRENDLPKFLEVEGCTGKVSIQFDMICAVGLSDFGKVNESEKGIREEFPHVRWKS